MLVINKPIYSIGADIEETVYNSKVFDDMIEEERHVYFNQTVEFYDIYKN